MNVEAIIEKKRKKELLSYKEIEYVIKSYVKGKINDEVMSRFIMLIYNDGFTKEETNYLTDIMLKSGDIVDLSEIEKPVVDKHSSGGIGDKISLIVAPIVASLGVCVPKMSGRGLGITGGTVDKLESIKGYKLDLDRKEFIKALNVVGCAVISQSEKLAVADKKIYALRNEIGAVDSIPLIASSIMSKKLASGANSIIIDLKVGKGAFMKDIKNATKLARTMIDIGKYYNKKLICILSDMNSPLGDNIGNALEVKEVIDFFEDIHEKRLYDLAIYISSYMVSVGKNITYKKARKLVVESINTGLAKDKFYEWIKYQGGDLSSFEIKAHKKLVKCETTGYINSIDAEGIGKLVFELGGGRKKKTDRIDYNVGFVINKTIGSKVIKGDVLGTIYYNKKVYNMEGIVRSAFSINKKKKRVHNIIIKVVK